MLTAQSHGLLVHRYGWTKKSRKRAIVICEISSIGHQLGREEGEGTCRHTLGQALVAEPDMKLSGQTGVVW